MKRKCLMVAPANGAWSYNFAVLLSSEFELTVFSYSPESESYKRKLEDKGIKTVPNTQFAFPLTSIFSKIRFFLMITFAFAGLGGYDVITFQYVDPVYILASMLIPGRARKTVISYWGSDLFHATPQRLRMLKNVINRVKCVAFDNIDLMTGFNKAYPANRATKEVALLPLPILDTIDRLRTSFSSAGTYCIDGKTIRSDRTIVSVGYNGGDWQNHIPVIRSICKMDQEHRDGILILLQATYSYDAEYMSIITGMLDDAGIEYVLFNNYLSEEDVAAIRLIVDVHINAQVSDAFAGSVCEYLYSDTILLNAKWLHYGEFDEYDFSFLEFDEYDQIPQKLVSVLDGQCIIDHRANRELVRKLRGVDECMVKWFDILNK